MKVLGASMLNYIYRSTTCLYYPIVASSLSTLRPCYSNAKPVSATIDPTI